MGHHVGSKKGKQKKQNSQISPLSAILCNDIIACLDISQDLVSVVQKTMKLYHGGEDHSEI